MARFDMSEREWSIINPLLPTNTRGIARVDERKVINGIVWRWRTGTPWADIPERYGSHKTLYNRFVRWRKSGVFDCLLQAVSMAYDGKVQMIDSSSIRVHQHGKNGGKKGVQLAWDVPEAG